MAFTFEGLSARIHQQNLDRVRAAFTAYRDILGRYEMDFRILHRSEVRLTSARGRGEDQGIVSRVVFGVFLDFRERKSAEETREMLTNEMSFRVKNLFAIASALTDIASRSTTTTEEMADDPRSQLGAMGRAHELVRPLLREQEKAAHLGGLLGVLLDAYDDKGLVSGRVRVSVPEVLVGEASVTALLGLQVFWTSQARRSRQRRQSSDGARGISGEHGSGGAQFGSTLVN